MRFAVSRPSFGRKGGLPAPAPGRAERRRFAQLREAGALLEVLPGEGESLHCLMTGRYDLAHVVSALLRREGPAAEVHLATLSYNGRALRELLSLVEDGLVGRLHLLCSVFFRDHNKELWEETVAALRPGGHRCAAARCHAKVVSFRLAGGARLAFEGSANLRSNGNVEQLAVYRSAELADWHAGWINDMIDRHQGDGGDGE